MFLHKITLPDGTALDSSVIRSVQLTEQVNDNTDLCPGAACAACAEIELWAPRNGLTIAQGTEITLVRIDAESGAQTPVGVFLAEKPQKKSANVIRVTAYDRMTLLDKDLSPWLREQQGAFPMRLDALIRSVCAQCGVTLADGTLDGLPSGEYPVQAFYADDLTGRQLIQWAAQAGCRFARMTPDGKLEFAWYTPGKSTGIGPGNIALPTEVVLAGATLYTADNELWLFGTEQAGYLSGSLSYEDYETRPIDKVQIRQSDDDVGVLYPAGEAGTNALVLQGNLLLTAQFADTLRPVAQAIYDQMRAVSYTPLSICVQAVGALPAPGEILTITDAYGRTMTAYIMKRTISGQKVTLESTGNARRDGTAAVNEQKYTNLAGKLLEIRTSVDGLNVKVSTLSGDVASLELSVDGLSTQIQKNYTDLKNYVDTDAKNAAVQQAVDQASAAFDETLKLYPTTVQMTSAIQQSSDAIELSVTQKLEGYVTNEDLTQYPTTVEMNSAISQSADQIELTVTQKLAGYTTSEDFTQFQQEYDSFKLQVVQDGEVRSAFAADTSSVTISSGVITFLGNTLVVDSDNFKLDSQGNVQITGSFYSNANNGNRINISDGLAAFYARDSSGQSYLTTLISRTSESNPCGVLQIYGRSNTGAVNPQVKLQGGLTDGSIHLYSAWGTEQAVITSGEGNVSWLAGGLDVRGTHGVQANYGSIGKLRVDEMSVNGGAMQTVYWKWDGSLGAYVLSTSP